MCTEFDHMFLAWLVFFVGASLLGAWLQVKIMKLRKLKCRDGEPHDAEKFTTATMKVS